MKALVLQGGGAKGAFQIGAIKALTERGYVFDGVAGTSIGAINAALYAQGNLDLAFSLWEEMQMSKIFDMSDERIERLFKGNLNFDTIKYTMELVTGAVRNRGLDTSKIRETLSKYIDEDKIRASGIAYGLVTIEFDSSIGTKELFLSDIPQGKLIDYIMASGALPIFKRHEIDGIRFVDGGFTENLPINMMIKAGYDDIVAIRLGGSTAPVKGIDDAGVKIKYIDPTERVGSIMNFTNGAVKKAMAQGYFDTIKSLDGLLGRKYYISAIGVQELKSYLASYPQRFYISCLSDLGVIPAGEVADMADQLTDSLSKLLKMEGKDIVSVWVRFAEIFAEYYGVPRWKIYSLQDLFESISVCTLKKYKKFSLENFIPMRTTREEKAERIMLTLLKELKGEQNG